ncbi:MAG: LysR family transcriptional regulator, partial [Gemmatimonadota bacterium]
MLESRDARLLEAVADEGNLTRASERLHLTPSALSHRLRKLERRLGTPLFRRLGRRMAPTVAGERLVRASREALATLREAEDEVRRIAGGRRQVVRIATECYTCYHWLPGVLRALREELADVEVRIEADATRRPVEALLEGRLDLAVVSRPLNDDRVEQVPLFDDEFVLVVSPSHELAGREWVGPSDLAEEHVLIYDMPDEESTLLREFLWPAGVRPRRISKLQLTEAVLELVKAGLGVAPLARWAVAPQVAAGEVVPVKLGEAGFPRRW